MNNGDENMQPQQQITMRDISKEADKLMGDITERTARVNVILRLMQSRFNESRDKKHILEDAMIMTDLCIDTLPHHYEEIYDPWEEINLKFLGAIESANAPDERTQHLETVIKAMTVTADPDTAIEELTEAGMGLYCLASSYPEFQLNWNAWQKIIIARGFDVGWLEFSGSNRRLHLAPARFPGLEKVPTGDGARNAVSERLSADEIETIAIALSAGLESYLKSVLASSQ